MDSIGNDNYPFDIDEGRGKEVAEDIRKLADRYEELKHTFN